MEWDGIAFVYIWLYLSRMPTHAHSFDPHVDGRWVEGFLAHGSSKTGTWGVEAKYHRGEMCDEAKTRVFKSAYNSRRVGGMMYGCDLGKIGEFMTDPSFAEIGKILAFKQETMMMKTFTPAPPPPA